MNSTLTIEDLKEITPYLWEIAPDRRPAMRVPGRVFITREMLRSMADEGSLEQLANVAALPGIERYSLAMPDIHQGYGFPIGGVAAIRCSDGVISPGGVGYDINCGVRLLLADCAASEIRPHLEKLARQIQRDAPSGVGRGGPLTLQKAEMDEVLANGSRWAIEREMGSEEDLAATEEGGCFTGADPLAVSDHAKQRGRDQLGTIGSGNHFIEIQEVASVFDESLARTFGIVPGQAAIMIHTGSRGLGHQICTDYVRLMNEVMARHDIKLPDRELACAPFNSSEGQRYFRAMAAAANFAWANRQVITHRAREAWSRVIEGGSGGNLRLLYDVAHNIAKIERYDGSDLVVHRKGATRAFGPGRSELPEHFRASGQPVLIPGSMGTFSYVLCGTDYAMRETFGSCCHGAGRRMSRMKAKKTLDYEKLKRQLAEYGVVVCAGSAKGLLEEAPQAYKDVSAVIDVVAGAGIANVVAKLRPIAVIKG